MPSSIQQFLDEPAAGFGREQLERRPPFELLLGLPQPAPAPIRLAEHFLAQREDAHDADHAIGFGRAQRLAPRPPVGKCPARHDQRVDLFVGQAGFADGIDDAGRESLLDELEQILIAAEAVDAEDLPDPPENARVFLEQIRVFVGRIRRGVLAWHDCPRY
jgi:hypothetical protein